MIKKTLLISLILLVITAVIFYFLSKKTKKEIDVNNIYISELPHTINNEQVIQHNYYTLSYNEKYEQANWVAYVLTKNNLLKNVKRTNKFKVDLLVKTESANSKDYKKSGYDRGHLLPAADMTFDKTAMTETFYYSNISPQKPGFNRGIWKRLESYVRNLTYKYDTVWVVTGPIFNNSMAFIGKNEVAVPNKYYKVLLVRKNNSIEGLGFILDNNKSKQSLFDYIVTIDSFHETCLSASAVLARRLPSARQMIFSSLLKLWVDDDRWLGP